MGKLWEKCLTLVWTLTYISKIYQPLSVFLQCSWKNWKPHELQRMCHPVVVEFAFPEVTEVFQSEPVSGALEDFLLQGDIACCDIVDNSGAPAFFCKVGEARSWKETWKRRNCLEPTNQVLPGRSNSQRWHAQARELKSLSLSTSCIRFSLESLHGPLQTHVHTLI